MQEIIIKQNDTNSFDVVSGDKSAKKLTWDELMGLFIQLTMPKERPLVGWLETEEEREARRQSWSKYPELMASSKKRIEAIRKSFPPLIGSFEE